MITMRIFAKYLWLTWISLLLTSPAIAMEAGTQLPLPSEPPGKKYSIQSNLVDTRVAQYYLSSDEAFKGECKIGQPLKAGTSLATNFTLQNSGSWHHWDNGEVSWILRIESPGAPAISLKFEDINIPSDAYIYVYSDNKSTHTIFTADDVREGFLSPALHSGDAIWVEYREHGFEEQLNDEVAPGKQLSPKGSFTVSEVVYIYNGLEAFADAKAYGDSEECHVDINCSPEGDEWQTQKRGIVRILYREGTSWYWCTGALVNNTLQNETPYLLTAEHCGGGATSTERNEWEFYFNFEHQLCNGSTQPQEQLLTGCSLKAKGIMDDGSDFQLLLLSSTPKKEWNVFYNGWDRSTTGASSGVSIHHPSGDAKKISTFTELATSTTPTVSGSTMATNSAWRVYWSSTPNGHGVTEGGSSGAPMFNDNGLIVGTLSGGAASCNSTNTPDYYAKLNYHWNSNGDANSAKLAPWLDPLGTNPIFLHGYDPNQNLFAGFTLDKVYSYIGSPVTLMDASGGGDITSWEWNFGEGAVPETATGKGPHTVVYTNKGMKTISLTINNEQTITRNEVLNIGKTSFMHPASFSAKVEDLNSIRLTWSPPMLVQDDSFESYEDFTTSFSPWIQHDGDGNPTYGIESTDFPNEGYTGSFIVFNPSQTNPPLGSNWAPRTGNKYAACFAAAPGPNKDWLITPKIKIEPGYLFSFYAKSVTDNYGLEKMRVAVSTTDTVPSSFAFISQQPEINVPTGWTHYVFDLSEYEGQLVHIAINCISDESFALLIDDVLISDVLGQNIFLETFEDDNGTDEENAKLASLSRERIDSDSFKPYNPSQKDLMELGGYRIFRNGEHIKTITDTDSISYLDEDMPVGTYYYQISATYAAPQGSSAPTDSIEVTVNPGALNLTVSHNGEPIQDAIVCFEDYPDCLTTNQQGKASINLPAGEYSYHIQSVYYDSLYSTVTIDQEALDVDHNLTASSNYKDFRIRITDGLNPINSILKLRGLATPFVADGGLLDLSLPHGEYSYLVEAIGFFSQEGLLAVYDTIPDEIEILLAPKEFRVSFLITGLDNRSIENATILIEGVEQQLITNSFGIASISLPDGSYSFSTFFGDQQKTGSFTVDGRNKTINVKFEMMSIVPEIAASRNIKIYPNPFSANLTVSNALDIIQAHIYSPLGKVSRVMQHDGGSTLIINTNSLPAGFYIVTLTMRDGSRVTHRVVKK